MFKVKFQENWQEEFPWLVNGKLKGNAFCTLCKTSIFYGSMGRSALTSHSKGRKHKEREENAKKSVPIKTFFSHTGSAGVVRSEPDPSEGSRPTLDLAKSPTSRVTSVGISSPMERQVFIEQPEQKSKWWKIKDNVTEAETLWCIESVIHHLSLRAAESSVKLFKRIFPDSPTALDMKLGKDKISYSIIYGLAPYFKKQMISEVQRCDTFVVGFDETLNKFAQKQQMDIVVRFWNHSTTMVSSRYLTSAFLNNTTSLDLLNGLKQGLSGLDLKKVVQLSMDGPNVNLKLLQMLKKELEEESGMKMLDIGSCGLHIVNVAFKTGIQSTGWKIINYLRSSYYLFKDSPSRRGQFIKLTGSSTFPKKFCGVRWLENAAVAQHAQDAIDNLQQFVEHVATNKKMRSTASANSYQVVAGALRDNMLRAKLAFFKSLAEDLEPFLREFQSDAPMVPFLHDSLMKLLESCLGRIVKQEVLLQIAPQKIDLSNEQNLKPPHEIDIGYATRAALRKCRKVKDIEILQFRKDCRTCILKVALKLLEKCPLKYPLTESASFLNPSKILSSPSDSIAKMSNAMEILVSSNLIPAFVAQNCDREFRNIVKEESLIPKFREFRRDERLDHFWVSLLQDQQSENLTKILKLMLPLSHGNATLERGFSINGDLLVENLKEQSIIAQRVVSDAVLHLGGIENILVTKDLLLSMRNANQRWKQALREQQERQSSEAKAKAEKRKSEMLAKELEERKKKLILESQREIDSINKQITRLKGEM